MYPALDQILNMEKYDVPESFQLSNAEPDRDIILRIGDFENNIALQENAQYLLELFVPQQVEFAAVHLTNSIVNISIGDPDSKCIYRFSYYSSSVIVIR